MPTDPLPQNTMHSQSDTGRPPELLADTLLRLADGNIGAETMLGNLGDDHRQEVADLLDKLKIRGDAIWILFTNVCNSNHEKMAEALREKDRTIVREMTRLGVLNVGAEDALNLLAGKYGDAVMELFALLDQQLIFGDHIFLLFNDVCGKNLEDMAAILQAGTAREKLNAI